jgi:hypothetical protein
MQTDGHTGTSTWTLFSGSFLLSYKVRRELTHSCRHRVTNILLAIRSGRTTAPIYPRAKLRGFTRPVLRWVHLCPQPEAAADEQVSEASMQPGMNVRRRQVQRQRRIRLLSKFCLLRVIKGAPFVCCPRLHHSRITLLRDVTRSRHPLRVSPLGPQL